MLDLFFNFLHNFKPQPVFLRLGFLNIYWYSFLIFLGLIIGYFLVIKLSARQQIKKELLPDLFFYLIIFGFIGARLYHVFSELPYYLNNPLEIFAVWHGGLGIFGGVVAGLFVLLYFARQHQINFWKLTDCLAPALILGQTIGRWGNYFNQEVFGLPTNVPWGIPISFSSRPEQFLSNQYFHPTFLYESIWNLLVFIILIFVFLKIYNFNKKKQREEIKEKNKKNFYFGKVFALYLILYSWGRFFVEFLRLDHQPVIFHLRLGQIFSLIALIIGIIIFFRKRLSRS